MELGLLLESPEMVLTENSEITLAKVFWLALPIILGGIVHVIVIKLNLLPQLAQLPLDLGIKFRKQPLFGKNKTWRGALTMVLATTILTLCQNYFYHNFSWGKSLSLINYAEVNALAWGILLGTGYIAGELPNSFIKRQFKIESGETTQGGLGKLFQLVDQVDSFFGVVVFMCFLSLL